MPQLKDGREVEDIRLDCIPEFDEVSREFPVTAALNSLLLPEKLVPISKINMVTTCLDQGTEGACCGFAAAHWLLAEPNFGDRHTYTAEFARKSLYYQAQKIDPFPGGEYQGADPRMAGTSPLAVMKVMQKQGLITSYHWAFRFRDVLLGLGYKGPAIAALPWTGDMYETTKDGEAVPTGEFSGYHCFLLYGCHIKRQQILCENSWGPDNYGIRGRFWMSFANFEKQMLERGQVIFPVKGKI